MKNEVAPADQGDEIAERASSLLDWYRDEARPFLAEYASEHLGQLDNDAERLRRMLARPKDIAVCFLGHSGVGKSTLLNALAAGREQILPSGGIGPLTALATEVHYGETPSFRVEYHSRKYLRQIVFALERIHERATGKPLAAPGQMQDDDLENEVKEELIEVVSTGLSSPSLNNVHVKQASKLVAGEQFAQKSLPYLIDCLRLACGNRLYWNTNPDPEDAVRIERIRNALELADVDAEYVNSCGQDKQPFNRDLKDHAAGFLAPLIRRINVAWPSELLRSGVRLVDLPGTGIAQDVYRRVTKGYIQEAARAVVLVVDRAGPTAESVDLLHSSGYWDRLVGSADDPESDPCALIIAVSKVDDVASEEWQNASHPRPRRHEVYSSLVDEFKRGMHQQIRDQLESIGTSNNETVSAARRTARERIISDLEIHPVSAPEYRRILFEDEEDRAFLRMEAETGLPRLRNRLIELAKNDREKRLQQVFDVANRLRSSAIGEIDSLDALWREQKRAVDEAEKLEKELEEILEPITKERDLRVGAFREFLEATAQTRIRELVLEARDVAEQEVNEYLRDLQHAHWATLRAAVRRGGTFFGARAISLPDDIAEKFQEPTAAVWSVKLLKDVRIRTKDFAGDQLALVERLCDWAEQRTEDTMSRLVKTQRSRIARRADQLQDVGKEAVTDLRKVVKQTLSDAIEKPIRGACKKFVTDGDDIGSGVKARILQLFYELARTATKAAQGPATRILQENFASVRNDIRDAFEKWGDPLEETTDLIAQRLSARLQAEYSTQRYVMTAEFEKIRASCPQANG